MSLPFFNSSIISGSTAHNLGGGGGGCPVGGWVELGRTTLCGTSDNIDINSLDDKRYYMVLSNVFGDTSGFLLERYRLNSDTCSNYANRNSYNGCTDATVTSSCEGMTSGSGSLDGSGEIFTVGYLANESSSEKLAQFFSVHNDTAGEANAPDRQNGVGKHAQTSNPISSVNVVNTNSGSFAGGSEVVVLGWDESDTHTNNFWHELGSDTASGSTGESLDVSFTARKYLWVQWYIDADSPYAFSQMRVGNCTVDSCTNYSIRYSINGGCDGTTTCADKWDLNASTLDPGEQEFGNMFIINNASNEKLMMAWIGGNNTGAGAANAPHRSVWVGKWDNTSNQIDTIQMLTNGSDTKSAKSTIKVWGSD